MSTEGSPFSSVLECITTSVKEAWEDLKEGLSIGLKEMIEDITEELEPSHVKIPIKELDWEKASWFLLRNDVVLSGEVGLHPDPSDDTLLVRIPSVIIRKIKRKEKLVNAALLLIEGSFTIGIDLVFPTSDGAIGQFLEIKAKRALLRGDSILSRIVQPATEISRGNPSEETMEFINCLTASSSNNKLRLEFDENGDRTYLMIIQDESRQHHVIFNDGDTVVYISQGRAYIKVLDKTLIQMGNYPRNKKSRLEIHVNEVDC